MSHTGRAVIREMGKGKAKIIALLCPYGHIVTGIPASSWAGSWMEAHANDDVTCDGTIPDRPDGAS